MSDALSKSCYKINFFSDNDPKKWYKNFNGIICIPPADLKNFNPNTTIICIASLHWREIYIQVEKLGFFNILNITNYIDEYKDHFNHALLNANTQKMEKIREILCDNRLKEVFDNIVRFRYSGSDEFLIYSYNQDQYFPDFFTQYFTKSESFIDCGAYDGKTIDSFLIKCDDKYQEIFAFEPDPENFSLLQHRFNDFFKINLFNAGVYREDTLLTFETGLGTASKICDAENHSPNMIKIPVRSLDSALKTKTISFIKMDIEGA